MSLYPPLNFDFEGSDGSQVFDFEVQPGQEFEVEFGAITVIDAGTRGHYEGPYEVDPMFVSQVLETDMMLMDADVTVHPIRVDYVSNESGGYTVYIGA